MIVYITIRSLVIISVICVIIIRTCDLDALCKSVAGHATWTAADRHVIVNIAFRILSTHVTTWIDALRTQTCLVQRTVCAQNTFGSAAKVRIAMVLW